MNLRELFAQTGRLDYGAVFSVKSPV